MSYGWDRLGKQDKSQEFADANFNDAIQNVLGTDDTKKLVILDQLFEAIASRTPCPELMTWFADEVESELESMEDERRNNGPWEAA